VLQPVPPKPPLVQPVALVLPVDSAAAGNAVAAAGSAAAGIAAAAAASAL